MLAAAASPSAPPAARGSCVAPPSAVSGPCSQPNPSLAPALAAEIIMFDDVVVVYKALGDLMFYVAGDADENEVVLLSVLQAFYESINMLLR